MRAEYTAHITLGNGEKKNRSIYVRWYLLSVLKNTNMATVRRSGVTLSEKVIWPYV